MRIIPRKTKVSTEFFRGVTWIDMLVGTFGVLLIFFTVISSLPYKFQLIATILFVLVILLIRIDDDANYMFLIRIIKHLAYRRYYRKFSAEELEELQKSKTKKKKEKTPKEKKHKLSSKKGKPVKDSGEAEEENEQDESKELSETE